MASTNVCRVCASGHSADSLLDIFKVCHQSETIADAIHELTGLKVAIDDGLPSLCCVQCKSELFSSVDIRRKCIRSAKAIRAMLQDETAAWGLPISFDPAPEVGLCDTKQENLECSVCNRCFGDIDSLEEHMSIPHRSIDRASVDTNIAEKLLADLVASMDPSSSSVSAAIRDDSTIKTPDTDQQSYQCCGCSLCFDNQIDLLEHSRLTHGSSPPVPDKVRPFQCNICYRLVKTHSGLQRHRKAMRKRWTKGAPNGAMQPRNPALQRTKKSRLEDEMADIPPMCIFQNYQCSECNEYFEDFSSLQEHCEKAHNQEKTYQIQQEHGYQSSKTVEIAELIENDEQTSERESNGKVSYRCCGCSQSFDTETELMEHSRSEHAPDAPLADRSQTFQCNICYSWYRTERDVRNHQRRTNELPHKCAICGAVFAKSFGLARHKVVHERAIFYPCKHCDQQFTTVRKRLAHEQIAHSELAGKNDGNKPDGSSAVEEDLKVYTCCGCGLTFRVESELLEHSRSIHAPNMPPAKKNKPTQCTICYRWYKSLRAVRLHQLEKRNQLLQCATCGKKFSRPSYLREHEMTHEKSLALPCRFCGEWFHNKSAKHRHMHLVHTTQETTKRVCSQCGKSFFSSTYLREHMNLHNDGTPYKCHCGAQFKLKLYLKRHMKMVHSGQFTCKFCSAVFPCASVLRGHENGHTGNREFSCEICGKSYFTKAAVRKHRQGVHEKKRRRVKASSQQM